MSWLQQFILLSILYSGIWQPWLHIYIHITTLYMYMEQNKENINCITTMITK
jgi:hypothetical protein